MELNEYMELAARTDIPKTQIDGLRDAAMGMVGEAAEALDHMKKVLEQGHDLDFEKLIEETGDNLWYIAKMSRYCGVTLEDVARRNIEKLRKRYPEGFSVERSVNRVDELSKPGRGTRGAGSTGDR